MPLVYQELTGAQQNGLNYVTDTSYLEVNSICTAQVDRIKQENLIQQNAAGKAPRDRRYLTVKVYSASVRCPSAATATHVTVYTPDVSGFSITDMCFGFDESTTALPSVTDLRCVSVTVIALNAASSSSSKSIDTSFGETDRLAPGGGT